MLPNRSAVLFSAMFAAACSRSSDAPPPAQTSPTTVAAPSAQSTTARAAPITAAEIGKAAPDFTLPDLDGHTVKLSDSRGKIVVLEWFNPGCPFVNKTHTVGQLKELASHEMAKGVVWLAINSAAPGKQGYGAEANRAAKAKFNLPHPVLLDESGAVGHAYGAAHTPHLFVIDTKGVLVYAGAIDNSPDGEGESPSGGTLINYVEQALEDVRAGKPVRTPRTEAYGCAVKYGA
ncbi:MAG TPA: thioredoxin family protein [Polyangiaceae bacterium]|nr:thioredoxin family protein [Polyangiaceae bacterium]